MGDDVVITIIVVALVAILAVLVAYAAASVRVLREYERGVVFRFGRLVSQKGPGLVFLTPVADRMVRVTLRTITHTIPPQDVITRDNVTARVNAVAYFRVVEPNRSVTAVEDFLQATSQISQTTLRSVLGKADLDTLLSERERLNEDLQQIIDEHTEPWGIKVTAVEIKDVSIPAGMQRAMSRQAEAERERRARVIAADGEFQASKKLAQAAAAMSADPAALQLRLLQTVVEVAAEKNSTLVMPFPVELLRFLDHATPDRSGTVQHEPDAGDLLDETDIPPVDEIPPVPEIPAGPQFTAVDAATPADAPAAAPVAVRAGSTAASNGTPTG